jgi:hypothetical protein
MESLGSLDTLLDGLQAEVVESKTVACWFASVGAWSRKALAGLDARSFREQDQGHRRDQHKHSRKGKAQLKAPCLVFDQADGIRACKAPQVSDRVDEGNSRGSSVSREKLAG